MYGTCTLLHGMTATVWVWRGCAGPMSPPNAAHCLAVGFLVGCAACFLVSLRCGERGGRTGAWVGSARGPPLWNVPPAVIYVLGPCYVFALKAGHCLSRGGCWTGAGRWGHWVGVRGKCSNTVEGILVWTGGSEQAQGA